MRIKSLVKIKILEFTCLDLTNLSLREENEIFRNGSRGDYSVHIRDHRALSLERGPASARKSRASWCDRLRPPRRERSHITLADVIGPCSLVNEPRAIERRWAPGVISPGERTRFTFAPLNASERADERGRLILRAA